MIAVLSILMGISVVLMGIVWWRHRRRGTLSEKQDIFASLSQEMESLRQGFQKERDQRLILEEKARRIPFLEETLETLRQEIRRLGEHKARLEFEVSQEKTKAQETMALMEKTQEEFKTAFRALSSEALAQNNQSFLTLAKETFGAFQASAHSDMKATEKAFSDLMNPVKEALGAVHQRMEAVEKSRIGAYEGLREQVHHMAQSQRELRLETSNLAKALRTPTVRGRWGEIQLRRVVEISGMSPHCDFMEQPHVITEDGFLRPDMMIHLPHGKKIIIDSKVPLGAYLEAMEALTEGDRVIHLKNHARQVRSHVHTLGAKNYWEHLKKLGETPEFVILFIPSDPFFSAALEYDPTLIEEGVQKNVILSTPSTLIALLHAVAFGWRQESLATNAQEICTLGQELYKRCAHMASHMQKLGKDLKGTVVSYNKVMGALERRVLPSARRFRELQGGTGTDIPVLAPVDHWPRDPLEAYQERDRTGEAGETGEDAQVA